MEPARYVVRRGEEGEEEIVLTGAWRLRQIVSAGRSWLEGLRALAARPNARWNALGIEALDSAGAVLLWQLWGRRFPASLQIDPEQRAVFARLTRQPPDVSGAPRRTLADALVSVGLASFALFAHLVDFIALLGQLMLDALHLLRHPDDLPKREISANIYKSGVMAMPVTALVGFLIGVVLSYLSSLQLQRLGADMFIVNILGFGIIREIGPLLVAVLVAGRTGSAMTAQLGVMRVTEEIDALVAMGVARNLRLVFPKVVALAITLPLLVVWTSGIALLGGMVAANLQLDIGYGFFLEALPKAVPLSNLWIGLAKGLAFGAAIALVACHFGLRVQPNTESLAIHTTASVVTAITLVILIDAVFAILTRSIGMPL
jgi:phospholipid/cholesterol/gamma-HCH transport system permease protein